MAANRIIKWTGDRVRRERDRSGPTLDQLAGYLGVTKGAIGNWERGANEISPKYQAALTRILIDGERPGESLEAMVRQILDQIEMLREMTSANQTLLVRLAGQSN